MAIVDMESFVYLHMYKLHFFQVLQGPIVNQMHSQAQTKFSTRPKMYEEKPILSSFCLKNHESDLNFDVTFIEIFSLFDKILKWSNSFGNLWK